MRLVPRTGWQAWVVDEASFLAWNGSAWVAAGLPAFFSDAVFELAHDADPTRRAVFDLAAIAAGAVRSFALPDVIRAITEKLLRRHPHVFGTAEAETAEAVLANWERLKKAERAEKGASTSPFASIPKALPALARADMVLEKLQRRALPAGAPAPPEPASAAALLETASAAAASGDIPARDAAFGQALLALVARARELDVDAETVLREQLARFVAEAEARTR